MLLIHTCTLLFPCTFAMFFVITLLNTLHTSLIVHKSGSHSTHLHQSRFLTHEHNSRVPANIMHLFTGRCTCSLLFTCHVAVTKTQLTCHPHVFHNSSRHFISHQSALLTHSHMITGHVHTDFQHVLFSEFCR